MGKAAIQWSFIAMVILNEPAFEVECTSPHRAASDGPRMETKFFWHPADDGGYIPAFLEGGPHPKAVEGDIRFFLYTLENKDSRYEIVLDKDTDFEDSSFVKGAPLKIISHGFGSSSRAGPGPALRASYFHHGKNYNVILVDWSPLAAAPWYDTAAAATKLVGVKTAKLIIRLIDQGMTSLEDVHFIGHSLGAHVGGFMGSHLGSGLVGRITALDPALPLFGKVDDSERIDPTDAAFVDVIHTSAGTLLEGGLAFREPRGHVDFYPNSGGNQPGCGIDPFGACSHGRSYEYMAESISSPDLFQACKCYAWETFTIGLCQCSETAVMGEHVSPEARGNFFLRTNSGIPWSIPKADIDVVQRI